MNPIICQVCGANEFKKDDGFFKCKYCNTEYSLAEIKKLMVEGQVEFVKGDAEKERLVKNAEQYVNLKEFNLANEEYKNIVKQFPEDYRGWLGCFSIPLYEYLNGGRFIVPNIKALFNALDLCKDKTKIYTFFDDFIAEYGNILHIKPYERRKYDNEYWEPYKILNSSFIEIKCVTIDDFTKWLLFDAFDEFVKVGYEKLTAFLTGLAESYYKGIMNEGLVPCVQKLPSCINDQDWCLKFFSTGTLIVDVFKFLGYKVKNNGNLAVIYDIKTNYYARVFKELSYFYIIGSWMHLKLSDGNYYLILLNKRLIKTQIWQLNGCCRYCGYRFKGIINKVCSNPNCNRPKDY